MGAEYLPLIESLMKLDAPIVLFGGFAEDAMLGGAIRRHHDDVDVLIERSSLPRGLEIFDELGFGPPEVRWAPVPGEPLVLGTIRDELNLELSVFDSTLEGTCSFTIDDEAGRLVRIVMPPTCCRGPPSSSRGSRYGPSHRSPRSDPGRARDRRFARRSPPERHPVASGAARSLLRRQERGGARSHDRATLRA